jgi:hypothetical protein
MILVTEPPETLTEIANNVKKPGQTPVEVLREDWIPYKNTLGVYS